jgi:pimeloyl-ACP methyl ester carboxylesterase
VLSLGLPGVFDLTAHDRSKYASLAGYADDVVEIGRELGLKDAVFVGHSVSGMIGALAAQQAPEKVAVSTFGRTSGAQVGSERLLNEHLADIRKPVALTIGHPTRGPAGRTQARADR